MRKNLISVDAWMKESIEKLKKVTEIPQTEVELILEEKLGIKKIDLILNKNQIIEESDLQKIDEVLQKRLTHMPLQYILGYVDFMGLKILVKENVLIPRQDTELLVDWVFKYIRNKNFSEPIRILDMCTGSGVVGITLMNILTSQSQEVYVDLVDISEDAIELSTRNIESNLDKEQKNHIRIIKSDLFASSNLRKDYDIIVSNPPYIPLDEMQQLDKSVAEFEPELALYGGEDGLEFYRSITKTAKQHLKDKGALFYEIGHNQGQKVVDILKNEGYEETSYGKDFSGLDRNVMGVFKSTT